MRAYEYHLSYDGACGLDEKSFYAEQLLSKPTLGSWLDEIEQTSNIQSGFLRRAGIITIKESLGTKTLAILKASTFTEAEHNNLKRYDVDFELCLHDGKPIQHTVTVVAGSKNEARNSLNESAKDSKIAWFSISDVREVL